MAVVGRPQKDEAADYYWIYIDRVQGADLNAYLARQMDESLAFFSNIGEAQSLYRYAPDKWSMRQALNHINDTERIFALRACWFARGLTPAQPGFDQDVAAGNAHADSIPWAAQVEEFRRIRLSTISLFANFPAEAWMRTGIASDKTFTVRATGYIVAGHVDHHVAILRERYLGASQKFAN